MSTPSFEVLIRNEPRPLPGNRCVREGCNKKREPPKGNYATREEWERDPFCSARCARLYYDVPVMGDVVDEEPPV